MSGLEGFVLFLFSLNLILFVVCTILIVNVVAINRSIRSLTKTLTAQIFQTAESKPQEQPSVPNNMIG